MFSLELKALLLCIALPILLAEKECQSKCGMPYSYLTKYDRCQCDPLCEVYKDCCSSRKCPNDAPKKKYLQFDCLDSTVKDSVAIETEENNDIDMSFWNWMVVDCPSDWLSSRRRRFDFEQRQTIQDNCRNKTARSPVSDTVNGFDYQNEHCALCNGVELKNTLRAKYEYKCDPILIAISQSTENYTLTTYDLDFFCNLFQYQWPSFNLTNGQPRPDPRNCFPTQPKTCLDSITLQEKTGVKRSKEEYKSLTDRCLSGPQDLVETDPITLPYKNKECALCNGLNEANLTYFSPTIYKDDGGIFFSLFLDIHRDGQVVLSSDELSEKRFISCQEDEVFDPVLKACRSIAHLEPNEPNDYFSDWESSGENDYSGEPDYDKDENETLSKSVCSDSLIALDNSTVFSFHNSNTVFYGGEVYSIEFNTSDGFPVICVNFTMNGSVFVNVTTYNYGYPLSYFILTYIGCSLSVIGCTLVLVTYTIFKDLRTLPSKLLMNLAVCILITNLLILLGGPITDAFPNITQLCVSAAILLHFFCLSQFSWMCMMTTAVVRSFYRAYKMRVDDSTTKFKEKKLFLIFLVIGWSIPVVIITISITINFTTDHLVEYGVFRNDSAETCWINHFESGIVAFVVPVALSVAINIVLSVIGMVLFCLSSRTTFNMPKQNLTYLRVVIAMFSVSGLTWAFGFVAILSRSLWSWYPFIILNSIQGFVIFLAFLCTRKVGRLYLSLFIRKKRSMQATNPIFNT